MSPSPKVYPTHTFHSSFVSFFESITLGCCICRQIWTAILGLQDDVGLLTRALEGSILATNEQFCHQVQHIQNAKKASNSGVKVDSSSDTIRFRVSPESQSPKSRSGGYFLMEVSTGSAIETCRFLLSPTSGKADSVHHFGQSLFEVKGLSTAAMPEVWRHWLRNCTESHALCLALRENQTFLPDRLIEIIIDEEVNKTLSWRLSCRDDLNPVTVPYLTLSHCWGLSGHVKLTKTNYGSFLTAAGDSSLPKTYRDAFRVTVSLGFRFLWIDSLCIIQDDVDDWRKQSLKMGAIYSNADCNIAATWASDGGDGCFNKRDPYTVTPTTIELSIGNRQSREFQISRQFTYDEDITDAPLNKRGWVVQERYLARKQLSFAKNQVYWECPELIASEQCPTGLPEYERTAATHIKLQPPTAKPRLNFERERELRHSWCSLLETYSDCHLTRPSDKMIALAGLAGQFRDMTGDTYLAGLWKIDLAKQLCWNSSHEVYYSDDMHTRSRTLSCYSPTWSWASYDGPVRSDTRYYEQEHEYAYFSEILDVSVNSEDSSKLHSFVSSELRMRGIMIWAHVDRINNNSTLSGEAEYEALLTQQSNGVSAFSLNRTKLYIFWDEGLPPADDPERFRRLREEQSSELLFVFVIGIWDRKEVELEGETFDGLVLRENLLPDGDSVFVRLGMFGYGIEFFDFLTTKLDLQPDAALVGDINFDDPRLADLIQEVTII